jgi:ribokinase
MDMEGGVSIVGSCNVDLSHYVNQLPKRGETITCESFEKNFGGKGSNQAVFITKISSNEIPCVTFLGAVGSDDFGKQMINNFKECKIENTNNNIKIIDGELTGTATILIEKSTGENSIILVRGANCKITTKHIDESWNDLSKRKVMVVQNEIPIEGKFYFFNSIQFKINLIYSIIIIIITLVSYYALKKAKQNGMITVFNPAPSINLIKFVKENSKMKDICEFIDCKFLIKKKFYFFFSFFLILKH